MEDQTLDITLREGASVVFEDEPIIVELHLNVNFIKLVVCILGILNEFPNPPLRETANFREAVNFL